MTKSKTITYILIKIKLTKKTRMQQGTELYFEVVM